MQGPETPPLGPFVETSSASPGPSFPTRDKDVSLAHEQCLAQADTFRVLPTAPQPAPQRGEALTMEPSPFHLSPITGSHTAEDKEHLISKSSGAERSAPHI